jgi:putative addiction module antidote
MTALKIRKIGNSVGVILPKEVLAELNVGEGDSLFLSKTQGGYQVRTSDPEFERQMEIARGVMKEYRDVLRELAK